MSRESARSGVPLRPAPNVPSSGAGAPSTAPPAPGWTLVGVGLVAAVCAALSVANRIDDPDLWQHLAVGKAIWQLHAVPQTHLWTWPSYGQPDVLPSWLFRALLWPVWEALGASGLFLWRAVTTLAALAILYITSRRMGARGVAPFVAITLCAILYRQRSQVRPETLVAVLLAIELWILETRRLGGRDHSPWLVALAWVWINTHISYHLGLLLIGIYLVDAWVTGSRAPRWAKPRAAGAVARGARLAESAAPALPGARPLLLALLGAIAISFVNPFGWRAMWQPFDFFLHLRHEPLFQTIDELQPAWHFAAFQIRSGLLLLLVGWPVLAILRARRRGLDLAELLAGAAFAGFAFMANRFVGFAALVALPFVARDLSQVLAASSRPERLALAWRAAIAAALCVSMSLFEWSGPLGGPSYTLTQSTLPVAACEFMAQHRVRGRGFNQFYLGGYQIYRFWPERERLPFMDIHASGTVEDRALYILGQMEAGGWETLDARHRFDYVLITRQRPQGETLLDRLDADPRWALVFVDDVSALYVRRDGSAAVAAREAYRRLPAGPARLDSLQRECMMSPDSCAVLAADLERAARSSPRNSDAHSLLANVALQQGRLADARRELVAALQANPQEPRVHDRLAIIALQEGDAREALREADQARSLNLGDVIPDLVSARAWLRLNDRERARDAYERVLARDPANGEAQDSLRVLGRGGR